jgi:hypothetical protein
LKEEALDRTLFRTRFGRGYGPVVRHTTEWMNEWIYRCRPVQFSFTTLVFLCYILILSSHLRLSQMSSHIRSKASVNPSKAFACLTSFQLF